jgi:hypothetical protein
VRVHEQLFERVSYNQSNPTPTTYVAPRIPPI